MGTQLMRKSSVKEFTYSVIGSWGSLTLVEKVHFYDGRSLPKCLGRYLGKLRLPRNGERKQTIREKLAELEDEHGFDVKYVVGLESHDPLMKALPTGASGGVLTHEGIKGCEFCFFYGPENPHRNEFARFEIDWTKLQRALMSLNSGF